MPLQKKQNGRGWCTSKECIQDVESPLRLNPESSIPNLHVFCLPSLFDKNFTIPSHVIDFMKEKQRLYIGINRIKNKTTQFTKLKDVDGNDIHFRDEDPFISKFFTYILDWITTKLMKFEDSLKKSNTIPKKERLFSQIIMSLNLTNEGIDTGGVNDWHRDIDMEDQYSRRQFSVLLTHHPQTVFATKVNEIYPNKYTVDTKDIRQCQSTEPGSSSYWNSDIFHRKQLFNTMNYNPIRMIIAIQFSLNNLTVNTKELNKEYYDSSEHRLKELEALKKVFGNDISFPIEPLPNKILLPPLIRNTRPTQSPLIGGKRCSSNKKFK